MLFSQKPAIAFVLFKQIEQVEVKQTVEVFSHIFRNALDSLSVTVKNGSPVVLSFLLNGTALD